MKKMVGPRKVKRKNIENTKDTFFIVCENTKVLTEILHESRERKKSKKRHFFI